VPVNVILVALMLAMGDAAAVDGFTVAVGGDVSLARGIAGRAASDGWERVLAPLADSLSGADARIVNLESAFGACLAGGTVQRPRLCARREAIASLARAGITAVTVANNHALDAGPSSLAETVVALHRAKMTVLGAKAVRTGKLTAESFGPITLVTANLSRSAWPPGRQIPIPTPDDVGAAVRAAREQDGPRPVLVILHGGREMDAEPSSFEHVYAQAAVEGGAAAVAFHGSHVIHGIEMISGVPVHLGLGNLLLDQRGARGQVVVFRFRAGVPAEVVETRCVEATTGRQCKRE
jgi:poly-gamma-glutamate capsule biosynthesis protein CapA/YwtB (metallophosphatase superfamily)